MRVTTPARREAGPMTRQSLVTAASFRIWPGYRGSRPQSDLPRGLYQQPLTLAQGPLPAAGGERWSQLCAEHQLSGLLTCDQARQSALTQHCRADTLRL